MPGKKSFIAFIVSMLLLVAFGLWVVIDSSIAYQNRPITDTYPGRPNSLSMALPKTGGTLE